MVYKNFQVCKEIYIPFDSNEDDGITLSAYKAKYGIDLADILYIDANGDLISNVSRSKYSKLYIIFNGEVKPLDFAFDTGTANLEIVLERIDEVEDGVFSAIHNYSSLRIDKGTLSYFEL